MAVASLGLRTSRTGQHRGSAMGAHYRHTTPEMVARIATAIEQRLRLVQRSLSRPAIHARVVHLPHSSPRDHTLALVA